MKAVDGVSFGIDEGTTLGLVGESGYGKTTTARLILQLEKPDSGQIMIDGESAVGAGGAQLAEYRRRVQLIFQDPFSSLNPHKKIEQIVGEPYIVNKVCTRREVRDRVASMLLVVNLPADWMKRYPHEMSGGQRQRVGIARALTLNPRILVCDEPVSALDVSIRSQIIDLQEKLGLTYLFIAHDLSLVEHVSDEVAIMYLGKIVEKAPAKQLFGGTLRRMPFPGKVKNGRLPIDSVSPAGYTLPYRAPSAHCLGHGHSIQSRHILHMWKSRYPLTGFRSSKRPLDGPSNCVGDMHLLKPISRSSTMLITGHLIPWRNIGVGVMPICRPG